MKIARFSTGDEIRYGIVDGLPDGDTTPSPESEGRLLVLKGDPLYTVPEATGEVVSLADARILSPVIPRSKVIGVGMNYHPEGEEPSGSTSDPVLFLKPNTSVIGPDTPIVLPSWSEHVDYEAELAVVVKTMAKDVCVEDARRVILGYTVANDVSVRDKTSDATWTRAKAFDTSCPIGPWIEIPEGEELFVAMNAGLSAYLNGEKVQEGNTHNMIAGVAELVSFCSSVFTLLPGDIILTGTPAGVGQIRHGDRIEVAVDGIGRFGNPVVSR